MRRKLFVRRCNGGSLPELLVSLKKLRGLQAFVLSAEDKGGQGWMVVNKSVPFLGPLFVLALGSTLTRLQGQLLTFTHSEE